MKTNSPKLKFTISLDFDSCRDFAKGLLDAASTARLEGETKRAEFHERTRELLNEIVQGDTRFLNAGLRALGYATERGPRYASRKA